jgi:N-acetylmuramate 1-kinase
MTQAPSSDVRLTHAMAFLAKSLGHSDYSVAPASADASFRRYFRVSITAPQPDAGRTYVLMDAPPEKEKVLEFIHITGLLQGAGLASPQIFAQDAAQGYLLLTDMGRETFLQHINRVGVNDKNEPTDGLIRKGIQSLVKWQLASKPNVLPPYDRAALQRELDLYPDWYVARHKNAQFTPEQKVTWERTCNLLIDSALAQPQVFVHRDFMARNLMVPLESSDQPGILDYQDAVFGPIVYDIASLTRDAFISWDEAQVIDWVVRYWEAAKKAGLPVNEDFAEFFRAVEWMGMQRHLKILGIFARINYRDNKPHYLKDTPRFIAYVRHVASRYQGFGPLLRLIDEIEGIQAEVGYTF